MTLIKREEEECDGEEKEEEEEEEPFRKHQPWMDSASGLGSWPHVELELFASIFLEEWLQTSSAVGDALVCFLFFIPRSDGVRAIRLGHTEGLFVLSVHGDDFACDKDST